MMNSSDELTLTIKLKSEKLVDGLKIHDDKAAILDGEEMMRMMALQCRITWLSQGIKYAYFTTSDGIKDWEIDVYRCHLGFEPVTDEGEEDVDEQ